MEQEGIGVMGKYGDPIRNESGERKLEFCTDNDLLIGNTWYKHKNIHQITSEAHRR